MPSFVICRSCGAQAPFGAENCPACGHFLADPAPPPSTFSSLPPPEHAESREYPPLQPGAPYDGSMFHMPCPRCGHMIANVARLCPKCGFPEEAEEYDEDEIESQPPHRPNKPDPRRNVPCPLCGALMFKSYQECGECGAFMNPTMPQQIMAVHASHKEGIKDHLELDRDISRYTKGKWYFSEGSLFGCWHQSHSKLNGKTFSLNKGMWFPSLGRYLFPGDLPWCFCDFSSVESSRKPRR